MTALKAVALCGSLRSKSYNHKLLVLARQYAEAQGVEVAELDLKTLALPMYDSDLEATGFPEAVQKAKAAVESSDLLLVASPEYNYSVSGALKNIIDWLSRGTKNSWGGKVAAIFGASTGPIGTARGQLQLRTILTVVNVLVIPQPQVLVKLADDAFNPDGTLKDETTTGHLKKLIEKTVETARKLKG